MKKKYKKCNGGVTVSLSGYLINNDDVQFYDWYGVDAIAPRDVDDALAEATGSPVTIEVDSPGGDLMAGAAIYTALMSYPGSVTIDIRSLAGSAASLAAMAAAKDGNRCRMSPMGLIFIHNVQGGADGDYRVMEATAEKLKTANKTAIAAYRLKTGMEDAAIIELMDRDTYLSAEEALELGLVDEILFVEQGEARPDTVKGLANALARSTGRLMNLLTKLPPLPPREPPTPPDDTIAKARALLNIEKQRF